MSVFSSSASFSPSFSFGALVFIFFKLKSVWSKRDRKPRVDWNGMRFPSRPNFSRLVRPLALRGFERLENRDCYHSTTNLSYFFKLNYCIFHGKLLLSFNHSVEVLITFFFTNTNLTQIKVCLTQINNLNTLVLWPFQFNEK